VSRGLAGAALGAVGAFVVSIPACSQAEEDNPTILCGFSGMTRWTTVAAGASIGGLLGVVLGSSPQGGQLSYLGPVPGADGELGWALGITVRR
jgi:hypothetical protein